MATRYFLVKNRSASRASYTIPEDKIRRTFAPGEVKKISFEELQKLTWQPGGPEMLVNFLQIQSEEGLREFNINAQPEYHMSEAQIIELIKTGSLDAFLDCLDYAPVGVIDLVKQFAVSVPLTDYAKKEALRTKTGFDVDKAIANVRADSANDDIATAAATNSAPTGGRRTMPKYNVVKPEPTKSLNKTAE